MISHWRLAGERANLNAPGIQGQINLSSPHLGLNEITLAGEPARTDAVLGVRLSDRLSDQSGSAEFKPPPFESYVRGADLIVEYPETADRLIRVQLYWRLETGQGPQTHPTVLLIAAVNTSLLDVEPVLHAQSQIEAHEILRLDSGGLEAFHEVKEVPAVGLDLSARQGPGCLLFRPAHGARSYLEMVHPANFKSSHLSRGPSAYRLIHRLAGRELEKGVILQSRVQGMWLPRETDEAIAMLEYRRFAESPPPLTA
jgi:hypothetical protein